MKKVIFAIIALVISLSISAKEPASPEAKATIAAEVLAFKLSGTITDKVTNESLAGAVISINGQKLYSDLDGQFEIKNTSGEKLQLKVSMISYEDKIIELDSNNQTVNISLSQR
jgi:hypothetical protein